MSKAFDSIKQGLDEALEFSTGKKGKAVVHEFTPVDVKNIRAQVGMTQNEFASAFGISVSTLRHWSVVIAHLMVRHWCCLMLWQKSRKLCLKR